MPTKCSIAFSVPKYGPSITVCVPVYNVELYVRECLDSIFSQDYPYFDVVMVDDGSTDGSAAICDEYAIKGSAPRVRRGKCRLFRVQGPDLCRGLLADSHCV